MSLLVDDIDQDRHDRTALITGGTAGIGLAAAQRFAGTGMRVVVTGQSPGSVEHARAVLGERGDVVVSDAGDPDQVRALADHVGDRYGLLDVLVLNAGIGGPTPFEDLTPAALERITGVNVTGPLLTAQALGPRLRDGGAIVLTTSIGSRMARPHQVGYDMSKASLRVLTRALAAHFLPRGVRVNAVSPGPVATTMLGRSGLPEAVLDDIRQTIIDANPMKRFGEADEVAAAIEFLALGATFTTGAELPVDGGWTDLRS